MVGCSERLTIEKLNSGRKRGESMVVEEGGEGGGEKGWW